MDWLTRIALLLAASLFSACGIIFPASDAEGEWTAVWIILGVLLGLVVVLVAVVMIKERMKKKGDD